MGTALGASLPYAVAAALSPVPITAVTLILLAHRGLAGGLFASGRMLGYALVITCVIVGSELIRLGTDLAPSPAGEIARFAVGAIALGAGIWTWLNRSSRDKATSPSSWIRVIDRVTPRRSAALGFALSAGPKSLVLLAGGGLAIAGARVTWAGEALAGLVFVCVAGSTAMVPVVIYYALGARATGVLRSLEAWMETNSAGVSAVLFILVGVFLIGSGISAL